MPNAKVKKEYATAIARRKSRKREPTVPWSLYANYPNSDRVQYSNLGSCVFGDIVDEEIAYEDTAYKRFGNCRQRSYRCKFERPGQTKVSALVGNGAGNTSDDTLHHGTSPIGLLPWTAGLMTPWPGFPGKVVPPTLSFADLDIPSLLARALKEMTPEIKEEMSLLVTLAELGDVKKIFTQPLDSIKNLQKAWKTGRKAASLLRETASNYLGYLFGTKQTVKDITALLNTYFTLSEDLTRLLEFQNKDVVAHWALPVEEQEFNDSLARELDKNWYGQRQISAKGTRRFGVTMKYRYTVVDSLGTPVTGLPPAALTAAAALDKLGVKMNPAILWDLVPFSFVIDWFIGVGDWLEGFKVNNLNARVEILDLCYSVKTETKFSGQAICRYKPSGPHPSISDPIAGQTSWTGTQKTYERTRYCPSASSLHDAFPELKKDFSFGQVLIGGALITTNLLR